MGYTHLFKAKYSYGYGTYFEYLAVTYGVWSMWGLAIFCTALGYALGLQNKRTPGWQVTAATAVSLALYFALWRLFFSGARS